MFTVTLVSCDKTHSITNDAVEVRELKYNPKHDYCFVTYLLDVGVRGTKLYKSILKTSELDGNLLQGHLPTGVSVIKWQSNRIAEIEYNSWLENRSASGNRRIIPLFESQDTILVGEIKFIITSRINTSNDVYRKEKSTFND